MVRMRRPRPIGNFGACWLTGSSPWCGRARQGVPGELTAFDCAAAYLKATLEAIAAGHPASQLDVLLPGTSSRQVDSPAPGRRRLPPCRVCRFTCCSADWACAAVDHGDLCQCRRPRGAGHRRPYMAVGDAKSRQQRRNAKKLYSFSDADQPMARLDQWNKGGCCIVFD